MMHMFSLISKLNVNINHIKLPQERVIFVCESDLSLCCLSLTVSTILKGYFYIILLLYFNGTREW